METALIIVAAAFAVAAGYFWAMLKSEKSKSAISAREGAANEFKALASEILERKSAVLAEENERRLASVLEPLKIKLAEFQKQVADAYDKELRDKVALKTEIKNLTEMYQRLSVNTENLTGALKGDSKIQGDWGETQLETILERAGLEKDVHYQKQESVRAEDGELRRPDYIVRLPDEKVLVIDSKVSLKDYTDYFSAADETAKDAAIKKHLESVGRHIKALSEKNYEKLYGVSSPDYVFMFVPSEAALMAALRADRELPLKALEKNIVLVSVTTLLAALRTVSFIWKQENQRRNVFEIARESGLLYDKFAGFCEDMNDAIQKNTAAGKALEAAMNKLKTSSRKGDTIIGRIERIKSLGASASKTLPAGFSEDSRGDEK